MKNGFLGIDTSNYTTSAAWVDTENGILSQTLPLGVKRGEIGLRQSHAVFRHTQHLPRALADIFAQREEGAKLLAVGVSCRPRNAEASYMPCFLSGVSAAKTLSAALGCGYYEFSHQEGHIRAAIEGSGLSGAGLDRNTGEFYSFHLSGGTCELLKVARRQCRYECTVLSATKDISLGQLVDRCGVLLGLDFPCGSALERLALASEKRYKPLVKGRERINLSGFENMVLDLYHHKEEKEDIARFVYDVIIAAVSAMLQTTREKLPVLFAGGVSASLLIREEISKQCDAVFTHPSYSCDNAIGIALLTKEAYENEQGTDSERIPNQ